MKSVRERMDINAVYREVGSYRGAAEIYGTTHRTVKRAVLAQAAHGEGPAVVVHNYDAVRDLVVDRVAKTQGRITAKRLLPVAAAAGYEGSARNFRRLVAEAKATWRVDHHRGRRPGVWAPGDVLAIDWGEIGPLYVFCAVLGWSRWRFVFFAENLRADTTFSALAACFEELGGVPKTVLSDRMGCLKGGTVAGVVVPTADRAGVGSTRPLGGTRGPESWRGHRTRSRRLPAAHHRRNAWPPWRPNRRSSSGPRAACRCRRDPGG